MEKVITGPPRAGKTYWAIRHVLLTYFAWDVDLFTWLPKNPDKIPFILTNVDGLKIEHVQLDRFLAGLNKTLPEFLTLAFFVPWIESLGRPVVLILDEAHGTFPYNFRDNVGDPQKSTLYFFGYHGHYPIDIYLITHSWTDLCPSIAQRAEYQIDAERRTMSVAGEFKYYYLHPKTQEKLNTQTVKSDKRIHMMYTSSSGEHKSNEIRPMRKLFIMIVLGIIFLVIGLSWWLKSTFTNFGQKKGAPRTGVGPGPGAATSPSKNPPPLWKPVETTKPGSSLQYPMIGLVKPETQEQNYIQVALSGAWVDGKPISVDLFGDVVSMRDLPYSYTIDKEHRRVWVTLPDKALASLRPGLWVDNARVLSSRHEEERKNQTSSVAPAATPPNAPAQQENKPSPSSNPSEKKQVYKK